MTMRRRPENRIDAIRTLEQHDREIREQDAARGFIPYPTVVETTHRGERN